MNGLSIRIVTDIKLYGQSAEYGFVSVQFIYTQTKRAKYMNGALGDLTFLGKIPIWNKIGE